MKKFLTAILALVVVASMASVAAFAADGPTVKVVVDPVPVGTEEVVVEIWATNLPEGGIVSVGATIDGDDALTATKTENGGHGPLNLWGTLSATGPMNIMLAVTSPATEDTLMGKITYTLPADAAEGSEYAVEVVSYDANNTFAADYSALEFALESGSIKVVAEADTTVGGDDTTAGGDDTTAGGDDTTAGGDDTTADADDTTVGGDDTTVAGDDTTEAGDDTTKAEDDTTKAEDDSTDAPKDPVAPPTGDMVFVVLAVMVVALGAAIVVKKVNVK